MRGEDHPQGAGGVAGHGEGVLRAAPVGHQPHQQLVGPGDPKGRREPLLPGPEAGNRPVTPRTTAAPPQPPCPAARSPWWPGRGVPLLHGLRHLEGPDQGQLRGPTAAAHSPSVFPGISVGVGRAPTWLTHSTGLR